MDTSIWVAVIAAAALLGSNWLQDRFARRRENRIRSEADAREERTARRAAEERDKDRAHQLEVASRRRREELDDAWRMTRLEAYRDFRSAVDAISEEMRAVDHACEWKQAVPEANYPLVGDDGYNKLWPAYGEVMLLGGDEVCKAAQKVVHHVVSAEAEMMNRVYEARDMETGATLRIPDVMDRLAQAVHHFTRCARAELGTTDTPPSLDKAAH